MPRFARARVPGGTFFFTVALLERKRDLLISNVELLRQSVRRVQKSRPFGVDAMVVLPDHLHCIWTLPPGDGDFSTRWRLIKTSFARRIPATERRSERRIATGERGIWQRRFREHSIRDESDFIRHIEYIHYNPVKHGYAVSASDWPYSSFHRYVRDGRYPLNWGGINGVANIVGDD